jgi:hypothetical protein
MHTNICFFLLLSFYLFADIQLARFHLASAFKSMKKKSKITRSFPGARPYAALPRL